MKKIAQLSLIFLFLTLWTPANGQQNPSKSISVSAKNVRITIRAARDVKIGHNSKSFETRGELYLADVKAKEFRVKKGQKFQMVAVGPEGSCRIRFEGQEYELASCPWREGFQDHQSDVFIVVGRK